VLEEKEVLLQVHLQHSLQHTSPSPHHENHIITISLSNLRRLTSNKKAKQPAMSKVVSVLLLVLAVVASVYAHGESCAILRDAARRAFHKLRLKEYESVKIQNAIYATCKPGCFRTYESCNGMLNITFILTFLQLFTTS
jgi:hypothetical protein